MAKKSNPNATYEYFKVSEVFINGRFKSYVDKMWTQNKIQDSMVQRLVDIYAIAAVIGLSINRRLEEDKGESDDKRTIQLKQLNDNYQTLSQSMKLVLMLDKSRGLSDEDRIRSAFVVPETREEHDANMELFNSYARGGIEYLYQKLVARTQADDDEYTDTRLNNIVALMRDPLEEEF